MPYKSRAQAGYFHTHEKEIGKKTVAEFDKATKGKHLPKRIGLTKMQKAKNKLIRGMKSHAKNK